MTTYEHKGLADGLGPTRSGSLAGGLDSGLEYGQPVRIMSVDGQKFDDWSKRAETKSAPPTATYVPADDFVFRNGDAPGPDEELLLEVPAAEVTPRALRGVDVALKAAREFLPAPGPPALRVRYWAKHERWLAETYTDVYGRAPAVFPGTKGNIGIFYRDRPSEIWVHAHEELGRLIDAVIHESVHAWRYRLGAKGMSEDEQESEAQDWAEKITPTAMQVFVELGRTTSW